MNSSFNDSNPSVPPTATLPPGAAAPPTAAPLPPLLGLIPAGNDLTVFRSQEEEISHLLDRNRKIQRVARIDYQMASLTRERSLLQRDLDAYKIMFDPVRRAPIEVLQEIFMWSIPRGADGCVRDSLSTRQAPWNVSHVSRRWREIALAFPALWAEVGIELKMSFTNDARKSMNFASQLGMQLTRSRDLDLVVSFTASDGNLRRYFSAYHSILPVLTVSASRWRELSWNVDPSIYQHFLPFKEFLSGLTSLSLHLNEPSDNWPVGLADSGINIFYLSKQLKSVSLSSPAFRHLCLPWEDLQTLQFKPQSDPRTPSNSDWAADILRKSVNLKTLWLPSQMKAAPFLARVSHVRLEELCLTYATETSDGPFGPSQILDLLDLPKLKSLAIDFASPAGITLNSIVLLVKRSQGELKELALKNTISAPASDELIRFLEELPRIEVLELELSTNALQYLDASLVIERILDTSKEEFLPSLKRFRSTSSRPMTSSLVEKVHATRTSLHIDISHNPSANQMCDGAGRKR